MICSRGKPIPRRKSRWSPANWKTFLPPCFAKMCSRDSRVAARQEKRLTPETLGQLWIEANEKYYGNAVEMPDGYRWGWSYIPHFIHSRFYCYSYVFGQLLVLALYRMYKDQ